MADYATLLRNHVTLAVRPIDRILLQAYVPKLQSVVLVCIFLNRQRGYTIPSTAAFEGLPGDDLHVDEVEVNRVRVASQVYDLRDLAGSSLHRLRRRIHVATSETLTNVDRRNVGAEHWIKRSNGRHTLPIHRS